MIRVLVVGPTRGRRRGLERELREAGLDITVERRDSMRSLGALIGRRRPDVIVVEAEGDSHAALPLALEQPSDRDAPPIVMLRDDLDSEAAMAALRSGVRAVLRRDATGVEIVAAVRGAAAGLTALPADLAATVFQSKASDTGAARADSGGRALTPREVEILTLLGDGLGNKAIAVRLDISEHTVKTHLAVIYEKLGAANRAEAVATGLRRGVIML
ncbi:MAG TPA: response regulator transcription factor [Gemmatimonadales bacterium]|nr:response regulator transcription factor [Gemmatimonadales bacterium]